MLQIIILRALLALQPAADAGQVDSIYRAMDWIQTVPYTRQVGRPQHWVHCRKAKVGCRARLEALAAYFVAAGELYQIDPWLLAGQALKETHYHPFAQGAGGERGVMQFHPRSSRSRPLRFLWADHYRSRCEGTYGECQWPVVREAAHYLRDAWDRCSELFRARTRREPSEHVARAMALSAYNRGKCYESSSYAAAVEHRVKLLKGAQ